MPFFFSNFSFPSTSSQKSFENFSNSFVFVFHLSCVISLGLLIRPVFHKGYFLSLPLSLSFLCKSFFFLSFLLCSICWFSFVVFVLIFSYFCSYLTRKQRKKKQEVVKKNKVLLFFAFFFVFCLIFLHVGFETIISLCLCVCIVAVFALSSKFSKLACVANTKPTSPHLTGLI